jgi:NADPH2:quinone reductase
MRAVTIIDGRLEVAVRPDPEPGLGQILVAVRAAGLNGADLHQVRGGYPAPPGWPPDIPGMELAGEVVACGPGATRFGVGDRVMAVVGGGAQAELALMHEREAMPVPDSLDWAPAGGVGTAGEQLGIAAGALVTATVRAPERRAEVAGLGATVIDPGDTAEHAPYDVILELVGAPNLGMDLKALAVGGRICVIGIGAGAVGEINLGLLMMRRARIHGSTLRVRPLEAKAAAARLVEAHVLPLVEAGRCTVPIDATFPLAEAAAAYDHFAAGGTFGKVILTVG